ncbi:MAG: hypothetical protein ACJ8GW_12065 [Massilia sp.]
MAFPRIYHFAGAAALLASLTACVPLVQTSVTMTPMSSDVASAPQRLATEMIVVPEHAYRRKIKADSQWLRVGSIPQGEVFKAYQDVFTLEGAHVHEAYLVIDKGILVGFYLPAERSFSAIKTTASITLK